MRKNVKRVAMFMFMLAVIVGSVGLYTRRMPSAIPTSFQAAVTKSWREQMNRVRGLTKKISEENKKQHYIVIDSGHGFFDVGKVGVNGAGEKDINLAIALKLRRNLEQQGYEIKMTRENDEVLYDGTSPKTKKEDMKKRLELMNQEDCMFVISIHQNSFTEEKYHGAQVFYHKTSEESRKLADCIQKSFRETLDNENMREIKSNVSYYILKKAEVPIVICECGFLSNAAEADLLTDEQYQEKVAWSIMKGVMQYACMEETNDTEDTETNE